MHKIADKFVELLKWPVAVGLFLSLPAFIKSVDAFNLANIRYIALFAGFLFFFVARTMMDASARTTMEVLAHEMTHAFFAVLTFHKVKGLRINPDDSGGSMSFEGDGNWLIIIAPYFFPLLGMITMIIISFYQMFAPMNVLINGVYGFMLGYHIDTVCSQIHEKQTDLPKVGYPFCAVFLPPANFWMVGCMMAFNSRGWEGVWMYTGLIWDLDKKYLGYLFNMLGF
ncbi:MAG: M50 family metallopeptidase [Alphaproteobacteria bacterium]|nr:M50 family metallopeptidase [Alphaproteobacteria bacterium]